MEQVVTIELCVEIAGKPRSKGISLTTHRKAALNRGGRVLSIATGVHLDARPVHVATIVNANQMIAAVYEDEIVRAAGVVLCLCPHGVVSTSVDYGEPTVIVSVVEGAIQQDVSIPGHVPRGRVTVIEAPVDPEGTHVRPKDAAAAVVDAIALERAREGCRHEPASR